MVSDRFAVRYTVRLALFALTVLVSAWLALETAYPFTAILLGGAAVLQGWFLIRSVERHAGEVGRFFDSVRSGDFTGSFPPPSGDRVFDGLHTALNEALERFRASRAECEDRYITFRTVVEHAGIGLAAFRSGGGVVISNAAARRLLDAPRLACIADIGGTRAAAAETILGLRPGERAVVTVGDEVETAQLAIRAAEITLGGERLSLVSITDIRSELEDKEAEAWQNLIRVLTHEIMNSITPIASLASTARTLLDRKDDTGIPDDPESAEDIRGAVRTIEDRSRGLLRFVESYRTLTRIPEPGFKVFPMRELFDRLHRLLRDRIDSSGVRFDIAVAPESLEISADPELMEQVLINLVQNALQALDGRPDGVIGLTGGLDDLARPFMKVADNGPGIEPDVIEKVFIPFFTTRREGSGIGLSLSRRIVRLHGGTITVGSKPDEGTVFTVHLPR